MSKQHVTVDYCELAEFRYQIRRFLSFSQRAARSAGIDPQQHQLLLAIRGLPLDMKPTIWLLAQRLQIRHHTAVGLINRCAKRGLVERQRDRDDRRQVTVNVTAKGEKILAKLSIHHRTELHETARKLVCILGGLLPPVVRAPRKRNTI